MFHYNYTATDATTGNGGQKTWHIIVVVVVVVGLAGFLFYLCS